MKKTSFSIILVIAIVLVFGALSHQAHAKMVLRYGTGVIPTSLYPHNYKSSVDLIVSALIFENLFKFDHEQNVLPALATIGHCG